jgi:hypothetical protein
MASDIEDSIIYDNVEETLLTVHLLDNSVYFVKR